MSFHFKATRFRRQLISRLGVEPLEERRLLAATVYVDDDWVGTPLHADPDGPGGPATDFGVDAFATIQEGINGVDTGGAVNVNEGTYPEDITFDENGVTLLGSGPGVTTIAGASGGVLVSVVWTAANSTIEGFTIDQGTSGNVHGIS
ncbi:MAG: hypothetical protein HY000_31440, partial [Planctomycetes bacterium]|nr:hypothetical protein [Planctomycetota bacterium]